MLARLQRLHRVPRARAILLMFGQSYVRRAACSKLQITSLLIEVHARVFVRPFIHAMCARSRWKDNPRYTFYSRLVRVYSTGTSPGSAFMCLREQHDDGFTILSTCRMTAYSTHHVYRRSRVVSNTLREYCATTSNTRRLTFYKYATISFVAPTKMRHSRESRAACKAAREA